jgi:hypothetical protein
MAEYFDYLDDYNHYDDNLDFEFIHQQDECNLEDERIRLGNRPPKEYSCRLPIIGKSEIITEAIEYVLDEITQHCFEDAFDIQESVEAIHIQQGMDKYWGRWIPFDGGSEICIAFADHYNGLKSRKKGVILLSPKLSESIDVGKYVFAHECGHVVDNGTVPTEWLCSETGEKDFKEASANNHLKSWGMSQLLAKVAPRAATFEKFAKAYKDYGLCPIEWEAKKL